MSNARKICNGEGKFRNPILWLARQATDTDNDEYVERCQQ
jgi:hypothetical protein